MTAALPFIFKYGIPLAAYGIGHLVGFLHHKHLTKNTPVVQSSTKKS